jgi:hypothetical protein
MHRVETKQQFENVISTMKSHGITDIHLTKSGENGFSIAEQCIVEIHTFRETSDFLRVMSFPLRPTA